MVNTDDVQGYQTKFANQRTRLEGADIDDRDREAIGDWIVHLRANDGDVSSLGTVVGHLNRIRLSAERAQKPLVEFASITDVNSFKLHLEDRYGLSEGTIRNYMKAVRKFFAWRNEPWAEDISVGSPPDRKHDPDETITADELDALLEAANEFDAATREKALIAVLRDTGLRIGAVLSFKIKHADLSGKRATLTINSDANVKAADGPKPITWSRSYLSNWLDVHPRADDPEAALFHKVRRWGDDEDGALRQQYAGRRIQTIAQEAGLDPDRIHAHLFRASAVSDWIREDLGEQAIKNRMDWSKDSRMFSVYSRVTDEEMNDVVFSHYGIEGDGDEGADPTVRECDLCGESLRPGASTCPSCGFPVDSTFDAEFGEVIDGLRNIAVEADSADERREALEAEQAVRDEPSLASRVHELISDE